MLAEQWQVNISNSLEDQWIVVAQVAEVQLVDQAIKVAFLAV